MEGPTAQIEIDPQQMKQVLINLIQNAADSIGENGSITLRACLDEKQMSDRLMEAVILEVSDTGKGDMAFIYHKGVGLLPQAKSFWDGRQGLAPKHQINKYSGDATQRHD
jgi:hypothetical protein